MSKEDILVWLGRYGKEWVRWIDVQEDEDAGNWVRWHQKGYIEWKIEDKVTTYRLTDYAIQQLNNDSPNGE